MFIMPAMVMKVCYTFAALFLFTVHCRPSATNENTSTITPLSKSIDVDRTINQVQTILEQNSELPRLSREEIVALLHDITAEDAKSENSNNRKIKDEKSTDANIVKEISTNSYINNMGVGLENMTADPKDATYSNDYKFVHTVHDNIPTTEKLWAINILTTTETTRQILNIAKSHNVQNDVPPTKLQNDIGRLKISLNSSYNAQLPATTALNKEVLTNEISNEILNEVYKLDLNIEPSKEKEKNNKKNTSPKKEQVMLVLPYTASDSSSLQELFTKPPRVTVIPINRNNTEISLNRDLDENSELRVMPLITNIPKSSVPLINKSEHLNSSSHNTYIKITLPSAFYTPKMESKETNKIDNENQSNTQNNTSEITFTAVTSEKPAQNIELESNNNLKINSDLEITDTTNAHIANETKDYPDISAELRDFLNTYGAISNPHTEDETISNYANFKPLPKWENFDGNLDFPEKLLLDYNLVPQSEPIQDNVSLTESNSNGGNLGSPYDYNIRAGDLYELEALPSDVMSTLAQIGLMPQSIHRKSKKPIVENEQDESFKVIPLNSGPDPVKLTDYSENIIDLKKRQNSNETNEPGSSNINDISDQGSLVSEQNNSKEEDSVVSSSSEPTTTEEPRNPPISDLEESFGGLASTDETEEMLPPPKKNGFYFMLDWNSFFRVGDGDSQVNIRFEPKLGDPQMFLPVSVP